MACTLTRRRTPNDYLEWNSTGHKVASYADTTGVNPAEDAGDTSQQYFGWVGRQLEYPPILLHRLNLPPQNSPKYSTSR